MNDPILKLRRQGKSLREIAKVVGISHVAVKKHLDRLSREGINTVNHIPKDVKEYLISVSKTLNLIPWNKMTWKKLDDLSEPLREIYYRILDIFCEKKRIENGVSHKLVVKSDPEIYY